jgi:hypothetical protein
MSIFLADFVKKLFPSFLLDFGIMGQNLIVPLYISTIIFNYFSPGIYSKIYKHHACIFSCVYFLTYYFPG